MEITLSSWGISVKTQLLIRFLPTKFKNAFFTFRAASLLVNCISGLITHPPCSRAAIVCERGTVRGGFVSIVILPFTAPSSVCVQFDVLSPSRYPSPWLYPTSFSYTYAFFSRWFVGKLRVRYVLKLFNSNLLFFAPMYLCTPAVYIFFSRHDAIDSL